MQRIGLRPGRTVRALVAAASVGVLSVGIAACGSSSNTSSASSSTTGAAASSTGAASGSPSGSPIKVMIQAPVQVAGGGNANIPNALNVGQAYASYINGKGGINGHPLQIITCDDHQIVQDSVNCARQAVSDNVVASVGGTTYYGPNVMPVYQQAKIAWFGPACTLSSAEFNDSVSFPTATCALPVIAGDVVALHLQGCKKIGFTNYAISIGKTEAGLVNDAGKSLGIGNVKTVTLPALAVPDVTPYVSQVSQGTDCVFAGTLTTPQNFDQWMTAWAQQGLKQRLAFNAGVVGPYISKFPAQMNGAVVANTVSDISLPVWAAYRQATAAAHIPPGDSSRAQVTWASLVAFTKIVQGMTGPINHTTFIAAASKTSNLNMGGLQANLDFTQKFTGMGGQYPRMFNRQVSISIVKDGKLAAFENGKFFDVTNALDGTPG